MRETPGTLVNGQMSDSDGWTLERNCLSRIKTRTKGTAGAGALHLSFLIAQIKLLPHQISWDGVSVIAWIKIIDIIITV